MGTIGAMASVRVVTIVFLVLLANTCQCKSLEDRLEEGSEGRFEETKETERDSSVAIQEETERAFAEKERALVEEFEERLSQLSSQFEMRDAEMKERLEAEVSAAVRKEVRDVPHLIQCAYQNYLNTEDAHKFVTFDRFLSDYGN